MSADVSPRDLVELTVRRLNRASSDLGLTLRGRPLFVTAAFSFDLEVADGSGNHEQVEMFDIEMTAEEVEDYAKLATQLEKLAEALAAHNHNQAVFSLAIGRDGEIPGQLALDIDA